MDLDAYFEEHPSSGTIEAAPDGFRSGFAALVGRPNSGKSTLLNACIGQKIAITSHMPQTTRRQLRAALTRDDFQLVLVDTPGLHKPHDAMGDKLNADALAALDDVDVVAMAIDSSKDIGKGDIWVADHIRDCDAKKVCVLTKRDLVTDVQAGKAFEAARELARWDAMVSLSAKKGYNVEAFVEECASFLPPGPKWFPSDMSSDRTLEEAIEEFIREKVFRNFRDEIPHSTRVVLESLEESEDGNLVSIRAKIYVERESQKGIIIGKGGRSIRRIGTEAREDLERLFATKVYLDLNVAVKRNWRRDESLIERIANI